MNKSIQFCNLWGEQAVLLITLAISSSLISQPGFLTVTLLLVYGLFKVMNFISDRQTFSKDGYLSQTNVDI